MDAQVKLIDLELLLLRESALLLELCLLPIVPLFVLNSHRFKRSFQFLRKRLPLLIDCLLLFLANDQRILLMKNLLEFCDEEIVSLHRLFWFLLFILIFRLSLVLFIYSSGTYLVFIDYLSFA